jgi:hypothetical protein
MLAHCFFPLKLEISRKCESEQIELDNKNASKKRKRVEDEKPTGLRVWKSFNGFVTQPPLLLSTCQTLQHPQQGSRHTS